MSITYTWAVTGLKTKTEGPYQDAVVQTYWKKTGVDEDGNVGEFFGATPFSTANMPPDQQFVPLEQLTEEAVLDWIKAVVVGGYEEHVNLQIQKDIDSKKNPIKDATLPWIPKPEPQPEPEPEPAPPVPPAP